MLQQVTTFAAEAAADWEPVAAKAIMVAIALSTAAISLGMIGSNYMKALGRNPEAGKAAGSIIIIAAMVELTALLGFAGAIIIS